MTFLRNSYYLIAKPVTLFTFIQYQKAEGTRQIRYTKLVRYKNHDCIAWDIKSGFPYSPSSCIYRPTCSSYMIQAFENMAR